VNNCFANSDWKRGWVLLSVVLCEFLVVEPIFEKSRSMIDFFRKC